MRVRFDSFYSYTELTETLETWAAAFPTLCSLESIGSSYEGRDIWLVTVTSLDTGLAHEKPALLVEAQIHAAELTATGRLSTSSSACSTSTEPTSASRARSTRARSTSYPG